MEYVDEWIMVTEDEIAAAMVGFYSEENMALEGGSRPGHHQADMLPFQVQCSYEGIYCLSTVWTQDLLELQLLLS